MSYAFALAQIGVAPPVARECTVEELEILIAGIDRANKEASEANSGKARGR